MPAAYSYIRFSSPEQRKGDSLRRQMAMAEKYATEHNLSLDTRLDISKSAYKEEHVKSGALGVFLEEIRHGSIKSGSYLLVESLDRLSCASVSNAYDQFREMIRYGITIVTLMDGQVYSQASIDADWTKLMIVVAVQARAHEESATKSKRISANWKQRRELARDGGPKLTKKCPRWLKLSDDRTEFIVIPEAAAIVERIFKMIIEGHGAHMIEFAFNREKVPTFGRKQMWNRNSILKIINNRWVLGEYQPMLVQGKVRTTAGDPIYNYYPRIISDATYHAAHQLMEGKRRVAKGRKGKKIGNLLTGLCKCGYCGGPVVFIDKGQKSGPYLICSHAKMGGDCNPARWEYSDVERLLMTITRELRVEDLSSNQNQAAQLAAVRGRIAELKKSQANLITAIEQAPSVAALPKRLTEVDGELNAQLRLEEKLVEVIEGAISVEQRIADLAVLREKLSSINGQDLYNLRLRLNSELKHLLQVVKFFPDGGDPKHPVDEWGFENEVGKEHRYVVFVFKNDNVRIIG